MSYIGVMIEACLTYVTKHPALIRAVFAVPIWKVFTFGLRCALLRPVMQEMITEHSCIVYEYTIVCCMTLLFL